MGYDATWKAAICAVSSRIAATLLRPRAVGNFALICLNCCSTFFLKAARCFRRSAFGSFLVLAANSRTRFALRALIVASLVLRALV